MTKTNNLKTTLDTARKHKLKHLEWIVEHFLEEDIQLVSLETVPERVIKIKEGLKENLFLGKWPELNLSGGFPKSTIIMGIASGSGSKTKEAQHLIRCYSVFHCYSLLKRFWEQYKFVLSHYKGNTNEKPPGVYTARRDDLDSSAPALLYYMGDKDNALNSADQSKNEMNLFRVGIQLDLTGGRAMFIKDELEIKRALVSLLEGVSIDKIRECRDETCKRWYIRSDERKKTKQYCCNSCASRSGGRNRRKDPQKRAEYNTYHRKYQKECYRKNTLGR